MSSRDFVSSSKIVQYGKSLLCVRLKFQPVACLYSSILLPVFCTTIFLDNANLFYFMSNLFIIFVCQNMIRSCSRKMKSWLTEDSTNNHFRRIPDVHPSAKLSQHMSQYFLPEYCERNEDFWGLGVADCYNETSIYSLICMKLDYIMWAKYSCCLLTCNDLYSFLMKPWDGFALIVLGSRAGDL